MLKCDHAACTFLWQEAQLSYRGCQMLRVIEHFAKSLKVTQGHDTYPWVSHVYEPILVFHCNYGSLVPFLRHSASNNRMTLKYGLQVIREHWKWQPHHSIDRIRVHWRSIVTALSCIISEIQRNWSKIVIFIPSWMRRSRSGASNYHTSEYCRKVWYGKTRTVWLPDGEKSLRLCLLVSTQYTNVTDTGQTDRHRTQSEAALMCSIARQKFMVLRRTTCNFPCNIKITLIRCTVLSLTFISLPSRAYRSVLFYKFKIFTKFVWCLVSYTSAFAVHASRWLNFWPLNSATASNNCPISSCGSFSA